jgi:hypothetical protein
MHSDFCSPEGEGRVKRAVFLALLLVPFALFTVACGGDDDGGGSSGGNASGDVSFMVFGDPEEIAAYREVIAAYENA